ncbi:barstar family protein [Deinococcus ruber]|uniref:Nuclease inhibitor n=1 Tax=Deinococcus ruber TaxID=1848197 RepID=A0A918EZU1_9DEIO|nr:barstar family protein [Deinococcus ruber]GGQ94936.1 nuclease inhibitor [Deinococcus ruber]
MTQLSPAPTGFQTAPTDLNALPADLQTLDLNSIDSKAELMHALAYTLHLPPHFGHNWDALYDLLSDPDARTSAALHLTHWGEFQARRPDLAGPLRSVLLDAQEALHAAGISLWLLV